MNICFFSQEYPPETHVGGIGTYTYNMACALAEFGHEVHVIAATNRESLTIKENGVFVHRIRRPTIKLKELEQLYYSYLVSKKVRDINLHFDIVQSSEFAGEGFWFALKQRAPLVTRLATPFYLVEELNGKVFTGPRPLFNWMEKMQTSHSIGIFSSTHALVKKVTEKWNIDPSKVEVIPNSIDLSRIKRFGENMPVPGILRGKDFLLFFGRLEERKGVHVLAETLPDVFKWFPSFKMVFVGSDLGYQGVSMREYISKKVGQYSDRLIFYDNLHQEKLFPIVNSAKMVVLPSLWEAFGFVCVEAMALGRPVIATSGSGFSEIIEDNVSGFLVTPGNIQELRKKITGCLEDNECLQRISEGAIRRAQDFEVSRVAVKLLEYYGKVREEWLRKKKQSLTKGRDRV